jgi:hypothetical protein
VITKTPPIYKYREKGWNKYALCYSYWNPRRFSIPVLDPGIEISSFPYSSIRIPEPELHFHKLFVKKKQ